MSDEYYSFLYPNDINGRYYVGKQTKNAKGQFATTINGVTYYYLEYRNGVHVTIEMRFLSRIEDDNLKVTTNSPPGIGSIYPPAIVYGRAERSTDNWF